MPGRPARMAGRSRELKPEPAVQAPPGVFHHPEQGGVHLPSLCQLSAQKKVRRLLEKRFQLKFLIFREGVGKTLIVIVVIGGAPAPVPPVVPVFLVVVLVVAAVLDRGDAPPDLLENPLVRG